MTKVIIEHDMHVVFSLADRISRACRRPHHRRRSSRRGPRQSQGAGSLSRRRTYLGGCPLMSAITMDSNFVATARPAERTAPHEAPFFAVKDIHAYYGESYIVQGVTFDIRHGEILALLGRNGAGKTSTLRTIARVDTPTLQQGEIWLEGQRHPQDEGVRGGPRRHPAGAGGPAHHPGAHGRGEPDHRAGRARPRLGTRPHLQPLPAPRRTAQAGGRHALGRRAADAGHRPGAGPRHQAAAARRAL